MFKNYSYLILWSLLLLSTLSNAQINQFEWGMPAGQGSWFGGIKSMTTDTAGNIFITSPYYSVNSLQIGDTSISLIGGEMFTAKIDKTGHTEWVRLSTGSGTIGPNPYSIATDIKGDCYIVGEVYDPPTFHGLTVPATTGDVFVMKVRTDGNPDWVKTFGGNGQPWQNKLQSITVDKGSLKIGGLGGNFFIQMDTANGNIQQQTSAVQPLDATRIATDFQGNNYFLDTDGTNIPFSIGGLSYTPSGVVSSMILKQDSLGNSLLLREFTPEGNALNDIAIDNSGSVYVLGTVHTSLNLDSNSVIINPNADNFGIGFANFITKFDPNMNVLWTKLLGGFDNATTFLDSAFIDLELDPVGNVYATVASASGHWIGNHQIVVPNSAATSLVVKLNTKGDVIWVKGVNGFNNEPKSLSVNAQGIYLYGSAGSGGFGQANFTNQPNGLTGGFITKLNKTQGTNQVSGLIFQDDNANGIRDNGEVGTDLVLVNYNDYYYKSPDFNGNFSSYLPSGTYTIGTALPPYWIQTRPDTSISFSGTWGNVSGLEFGVKSLGNIQDLEVYVTSTAIRPGFDVSYFISYKNTGTIPMSGTLELVLDDTLNYLSSTPSGTYNQSKVTWNYNNLQVGETRLARVICEMPVALGLLGTDLVANATIQPLASDTTPINNLFTHTQTVTGSYDPNDKLVSPESSVDTNFIQDGTFLYTIRFQNTGNDTAFTVRVADTLDTKLDISTLQMIGTSHDYVFELDGRAIMWTFNNILLPDSTTNEPESHGFIKYSIRPRSTTVLDDTITNTAHIYFDFNPPIITNTTMNAVEIITQTHRVIPTQLEKVTIFPNPTNGWVTCEIENFQPNETYFFRLFDIQGRAITQYELRSDQQSVDLNMLPAGMYVFQLISTENGLKSTGKIMKQ